MLIAFFNMIGRWGCGWIGDRYRKKYALSILYTFRSLLIFGFVLLPITPLTIVIFSAGVGLTWLGTLPLVSGIIIDVFGIRHMTMLFGIVYFSHQLGAFSGVWRPCEEHVNDVVGEVVEGTGSPHLVASDPILARLPRLRCR